MKMTAFSSRVAKEIIRDPLSLIFGLCFPVVLLLLLSACDLTSIIIKMQKDGKTQNKQKNRSKVTQTRGF